MDRDDSRHAFASALDALIAEIARDRTILAALLCGSLAHDTVWARSDIDLVLITVDDPSSTRSSIAINASGVNVHAFLLPRARFRQLCEGSLQQSFMHALLAKGRLLFTHDATIARLCEGLRELGERDRQVQRLRAAASALPAVYKARKWLVTRGDLDYTALWILYAATSLAQLEVIGAGLVADREVLPVAATLNPELFATIYTGLLNAPKTRPHVEAALDTVERYLSSRAPELFAPVLAHLREANEARTASDIEAHFLRQFDIRDVATACEYLADLGLVSKVSLPARLTRRSRVEVQELAFVHFGSDRA